MKSHAIYTWLLCGVVLCFVAACSTKTTHHSDEPPIDEYSYEVEGETIETDVSGGYIDPAAEALPGEESWSVTTTTEAGDGWSTTTVTEEESWSTTPAGDDAWANTPAAPADEGWASTPAGPALPPSPRPIVRPGSVYTAPVPPAARTYPDYDSSAPSGYPGSGGGGGSYTVQRGDTLWAISRRFGTSVRALADANALNPNGVLPVGKTLVIPGGSGGAVAAPAAAGTVEGGVYTVQRGDTLWALSRRFSTTVDAIAHANGMDPNATLKIGQQLKMP